MLRPIVLNFLKKKIKFLVKPTICYIAEYLKPVNTEKVIN